jgi:hypothetical protein
VLLLATVFAIGILEGLMTYRRGAREPDDGLRCRKRGYSLRALQNPRCPECGTPFALPGAKPFKAARPSDDSAT